MFFVILARAAVPAASAQLSRGGRHGRRRRGRRSARCVRSRASSRSSPRSSGRMHRRRSSSSPRSCCSRRSRSATGTINLFGVGLIFAMMIVSLVVLTGWAGQISLGQLAFVAFGAAVAGTLAQQGKDFFLSLLVAGLVGAVVAMARSASRRCASAGCSSPVTTLAFAVTTGTYFLNEEFFPWLVPGYRACAILRPRRSSTSSTSSRSTRTTTSCSSMTALVIGAVWSLRHSRTGRSLVAVRDNTRACAVVRHQPRPGRAHGVRARRVHRRVRRRACSSTTSTDRPTRCSSQRSNLRDLLDRGDRRARLDPRRAVRRRVPDLPRLLAVHARPGERLLRLGGRPAVHPARSSRRTRRAALRHARHAAAARRAAPRHRRPEPARRRPRPRRGRGRDGAHAGEAPQAPRARPRRRAARRSKGSTSRTARHRCCSTSTSTSTQGEIVALLGTNGAGKSTLLAAIAGTVTPRAQAGSRSTATTSRRPDRTTRSRRGRPHAGLPWRLPDPDRRGEPPPRRVAVPQGAGVRRSGDRAGSRRTSPCCASGGSRRPGTSPAASSRCSR